MFKHKKIVTLLILTAMLLTLLPTAGFAETLASPDAAAETVIEDAALVENNTDSTTPEKDGSAADTDLPANEQPDTETPADNSDNESAEEGGAEADNQTTQNKEDAKTDTEAAAELPQVLAASETRELTIYHILTTDGKPKNADNFIYEYKVEHLTYPAGYKFESIENIVAGKVSNLAWSSYWTAPQSNWEFTSYEAAFPDLTMPTYDTNIELYYKLDVNTDDIRYSVPTGNFYQIMIDDKNPRHAFCLNKDLINPANRKNIPYKKAVPFTDVAENYSTVSEELISNILLVGYPCDALGLLEQYGISDTYAESLTQDVIWFVLNQSGSSIEDPFAQAIYKEAKRLTDEKITITYEALSLGDGLTSLHFIEQENGVFATQPVSIQGYHDQYIGTVALSLPNTMAVYSADGKILDPAQLPVNTPLVFTSSMEPMVRSIAAEEHVYNLPNQLWFYEAHITGYTDKVDTGKIALSKGFQNLLAYDFTINTITASFPVTVTTKAAPIEPADPVDPTPVDPDNNSGGNDTPDTPSTPSEPAAPAETLLPDENTPLAPAPEIAPEGEAEVTLDEEPVPLAPAAPISDNPKTGHPTNGIFILQICLLLAAAALLLKDLRQYKKAQ